MTPPKPNRADLLFEYDRLCRLLVKSGGEPIVSDAVLDVFTDGELMILVRDTAFMLVRLRRLEA